jgi:hypothetical protein
MTILYLPLHHHRAQLARLSLPPRLALAQRAAQRLALREQRRRGYTAASATASARSRSRSHSRSHVVRFH